MCTVLWIDDQYMDKEMIQFAIEAENEGVSLRGYSSFEEGFDELEKNLEQYDVVLLDGLFFEKKGQEIGTEDESGIGMAIAKINELKSKKVFPWFVLSGKDSFTKGENSILKANKALCFDKTNPTDVVSLFGEIKKAASNQFDFQLKHQYRDLLEVCSENQLGIKHFSRILFLIKHVENVERMSNSEDMLNSLRKIVEALFWRLGEIGIIPIEIIKNMGWITKSSLFLSNRHSDYEHIQCFIHPLIAENIHRLLNVIQDGSHGEGDLKLKVDDYLKSSNTDFLYKSCTYLLFDILVWFKILIDKNHGLESNKALWKRKNTEGEWVFGVITKISENGYGTFTPDDSLMTLSILPKLVNDNNLSEGLRVNARTQPSPDGSKTHIKEISTEI